MDKVTGLLFALMGCGFLLRRRQFAAYMIETYRRRMHHTPASHDHPLNHVAAGVVALGFIAVGVGFLVA
ncbi:hypothetical protein ACFVH6_17340 [Spirillospora sp. NPDC127200]